MANISGSYAYSDTLRVVHYGPGSLSTALPKTVELFKPSKVFVVTGNSLRTKTDVISRVEALLQANHVHAATFSSISQHSPIAQIREGVEEIKRTGSDLIISVGGGSPIDATKAMIYFLQQERGGEFMKQIAIPTTLSAAEYTTGAGYTSEVGHKRGVQSTQLAPAAVILDAELTLHTPERLWLSTGMRALDHAVENLYRPGFPVVLRPLAYSAIKDLFEFLPISKERPADLHVRQKLQIAAWTSLWPFRMENVSAIGLSHALGHMIGATYGVGHGITSCLTLGPVVKFKAMYASEADVEVLAQALSCLGVPPSGDRRADVLRFGEEIEGLVRSLGLHSTFQDHGIPEEALDKIASVVKHFPEDAAHQEEVRNMLARL